MAVDVEPPSHLARADSDDDLDSHSPRKRRKYIPGGTGGGGQFISLEGRKMAGRPPGPASPHTRSTRAAAAGYSPVPRPAPRAPRLHHLPSQPAYSSAAAVAAAVQSDGYKPREERSWEEFHPDLDTEASLQVFGADIIDGTARSSASTPSAAQSPASTHPNGAAVAQANEPPHQTNGVLDAPAGTEHHSPLTSEGLSAVARELYQMTPIKRRPGRPPRRPEAMLTGLGSPPAPRIVPTPAQNPRERLNLPKPSFRIHNPFLLHEADRNIHLNYVDKSMANVGFQESEEFIRLDRKLIRLGEPVLEEDVGGGLTLESDPAADTPIPSSTTVQVEYDMDEQDLEWLNAYNNFRSGLQLPPIKPAIFEITMTQIEKEWHALEKRIPKPNPKPPQTQRPRSSSAAAVNGEPPVIGEEQDTKCAICDDGDCENTNAIVFCDGCDLAVHQECYGVPFIPEGQWLCRKCQLIGRGTPTCIFCPNFDGAFKLTHESRWAHLLCAIWIPEVTLGNLTFMEPIMDVAKVPKQRWRLNCYICSQKMGACIQCGNRACYQAFHVTCARRAKLFLKMKSTHGGPATLDASVLKAFCDKHVPSEWRREHDVDTATAKAKSYYRKRMKGQQWADSQESALALVPSQQFDPSHDVDPIEAGATGADTATQKRKRAEAQKNIWRLPSGAPVVPRVVLDSVETTLQRFMVPRRKDFTAEACKYWTLKREARRGAALLKRLQLQLETFSSSEISRRDFSSMGSAGGPKLQRRIEFAGKLLKEMTRLTKLAEKTKAREAEKLRDAELLREVVDSLYFPLIPLLWPILRKAQHLDPKGQFRAGFRRLQTRLEDRHYTSVAAFSSDVGAIFSATLGLGSDVDAKESAPGASTVDAADVVPAADLKDAKLRARRIMKAIQQPLEDATRSEAELGGRPFEKELKSLELLLHHSVGLGANDGADESLYLSALEPATTPAKTIHEDSLQDGLHETNGELVNGVHESTDQPNGTSSADAPHEITPPPAKTPSKLHRSGQDNVSVPAAPLTPPFSEKDLLAPLAHGGIPWYLEPFDPIGTTVHDERWTGRDVLRGMSEELSEIDEADLQGLRSPREPEASLEEPGSADDAEAETSITVGSSARKMRKRPRRW